jgi:hypothetical protein
MAAIKVTRDAVACPSQDFAAFLKAFSTSADVQRAFSRSPLQYDRVASHGGAEPAILKHSVQRAAPGYYSMLSPPAQAKEMLEQKMTAQGRDVVVLVLSKPDTDYQVEYLFRRSAGCWQLQRISDHSL